jgi:hypothetical protein
MKILLFCAVILISYQSQSEVWQGYRNTNDLSLPYQQFVESSVYRMMTVGDLDSSSLKPTIADLTKPPYNQPIRDKTRLENDSVQLTIETCRNQNLTKCPIIQTASSMTAFFNNRELHTCRHGFHNWLKWAADANQVPIEKISPPIILWGKNDQEPVYNSALVEQKDLLYFSLINKNPKLYSESNYSMNSDYVAMKSEGHFFSDEQLPTSKTRDDIQWDTEVFMFGYPAKTDMFVRRPGNAPGDQLVVSSGLIRSFAADSATYSSTHLATEGASGSPVISKNGMILGVSCFGTWYPSDQGIGSDSQVIYLNKAFLKKFWSQP